MAEKLVSIGAKYGHVSVKDFLPCSTTVSRHLDSVVQKDKNNLKKLMRKENKLGIFGVTTDMWTVIRIIVTLLLQYSFWILSGAFTVMF